MIRQKQVPVSVVVPAYQASATITPTLQSVFDQFAVPREILVVDDGSDDGMQLQESVARLSERNGGPIRLLRLDANRGPAAARNHGWDHASLDCSYVAFLDADDFWCPNKLERQTAWMQANPGVAWSAHRIGRRCPAILTDGSCHSNTITRHGLLGANPVATPSVMIHRRISMRFREELRYCEDLMLWLDLVDNGARGVLLHDSLATLGRAATTAGGLTGDLSAMHKGMIDLLQILVREGRLTPDDQAIFSSWEALRYVRRLVRRAVS